MVPVSFSWGTQLRPFSTLLVLLVLMPMMPLMLRLKTRVQVQEAACSAMSVMEEEFGYGMQAYLDPIVRCVQIIHVHTYKDIG